MKLDEVIANLDRTIEGKLDFCKALETEQEILPDVRSAVVPMLKLNIRELSKIRIDLLKVKNGA